LVESNKKKINKLKRFLSNPFTVVLDGGNIIFSQDRNITIKNYKLLLKFMRVARIKFGNPLLIIHNRHLNPHKKSKKIKEQIERINSEFSDNIFNTPNGVNDDFYILYASLSLKIPIISKDKFRDHIFMFGSKVPNSRSLKHFFDLHVLNYPIATLKTISIDTMGTYSRCIQVKDTYIYIPVEGTDSFYKYVEPI